jgi:quaternary ammonium compound-resistance protein SugE
MTVVVLRSPQIAPGRDVGQTNGIYHMAWALLSIAGILEIAFALCMKWSEGFTRLMPGLFTAAAGLSSVFLLSLSLRTLPVGTGYAVWTGIGAAGTAILGMVLLGDPMAPTRILCIGLILAGVIGLRLVS